jgi:acetoin utilization deacetylase AcuC-like enzyme
MGFCFFNNTALAALHALEARGVAKVAVLDFDAHHGNGTEEILGGDSRVLICQTFQADCYPFSGRASEGPNRVNVPLRPGDGSREFRMAVEGKWLPAIHAFSPGLLLVSAGFDAHSADPLSGLDFQDDDYGWIGERVADTVGELGVGVVSILEGGYDLEALERSVERYLRGSRL